MKLLINFQSRILHRYHSRNFIELKLEYCCLVYSLIIKKQLQKNSAFTNSSNRSNDHTFGPNTINTTVQTLSRLPLVLLKFVETCSLSSTDNYPFQTKTKLNANANPSMSDGKSTLYRF